MKHTTLELKNGIKFYVSGNEITRALRDINIRFQTGEFVAITGESGSGKSTLAHILGGIITADKGELYLDGVSTVRYGAEEWENYRRDEISFIAQNYGILPGNTVYDNVVSALALAEMTQEQAAERAEKLLKQVDLWHLKKRRAAKLSSGQKQRLSIARAVAKPAPILIADEPTSNLDAANVDHIIRLLKEEAQQRLVIMVTHNYEAAAGAVTRHVEIVNGEIVLDEPVTGQVCDTEHSEKTMGEKRSEGKRFPLGRYIAALQMKARPVWVAFMVAFFSVTAFAVFAFLGTLLVALDDTDTRRYNEEAFFNGDTTRLVVMREDGLSMSQEDYETFFSIPWVVSMERYGMLNDINYYYRRDVDFEVRYVQTASGYAGQIVLTGHTQFAKTVPVLCEGEEFLTAGHLPEHFNEVVAVGGEELIGQTVEVYISDRNNWGADTYLCETMTIVGVTDLGEGLYFDERLGIMMWQKIKCTDLLGNYFYGIDTAVEEEGFTVSSRVRTNVMEEIQTKGSMSFLDLSSGEYLKSFVEYRGTNEQNHPWFFGLSEELFDVSALDAASNQVSLYLKDYSYTDRAMKELKKLGYEVISPYRTGSVEQSSTLKNERMMTIVLCLAATVIVLLAQAVVLSAMFAAQTAAYIQLRTLGLTYEDAKASLLRQVLALTVVGQLLGAMFVAVGAWLKVTQFENLVKHLELWYVILLSLVHLLASGLVFLMANSTLRKRVFPFVPRSYEIDLSELAEKERER